MRRVLVSSSPSSSSSSSVSPRKSPTIVLWHLNPIHILIVILLSKGTMGPAAAREDPQETWLSESQISWCGEFARRWSVKRPAEHRLAIANPISQHRLASHLSRSTVQGAMVHGECRLLFFVFLLLYYRSIIYSIWYRFRTKGRVCGIMFRLPIVIINGKRRRWCCFSFQP